MPYHKKVILWLKNESVKPALLIFIAALSVRLTVVALFPDLIPPATDKLNRYDPIALSLLKGEGFTIDGSPAGAAQAPPVYPIFLSMFYFLFGASNLVAKISLSVIDAGQCLMFYLIARRCFAPRSGVLTGIVLTILPHSIYTILAMSVEPLFIFLLSLSLFFLSTALQENRARDFFLSGIMMGIATLCRAVSLLLPFFMVAIFIVFGPKKLRRGLLIFASISLLVMSSWVIRNYVVLDRFVPVQSLGGHALYYATFKASDENDKRALSNHRKTIRENDYSSIDRDRFFYRTALSRIVEDPLKFLKLMGKRVWSMWYRTHSGRYGTILKITHGVLLVFAIAGIIISRRDWRDHLHLFAMIVYFIALHMILIGIARYLFPIIPLLIIFATSPVAKIINAISSLKLAASRTARK